MNRPAIRLAGMEGAQSAPVPVNGSSLRILPVSATIGRARRGFSRSRSEGIGRDHVTKTPRPSDPVYTVGICFPPAKYVALKLACPAAGCGQPCTDRQNRAQISGPWCGAALLHGSQLATGFAVPKRESPNSVAVGHPEFGHRVENVACESDLHPLAYQCAIVHAAAAHHPIT
jgi:hypothetical protein